MKIWTVEILVDREDYSTSKIYYNFDNEDEAEALYAKLDAYTDMSYDQKYKRKFEHLAYGQEIIWPDDISSVTILEPCDQKDPMWVMPNERNFQVSLDEYPSGWDKRKEWKYYGAKKRKNPFISDEAEETDEENGNPFAKKSKA